MTGPSLLTLDPSASVADTAMADIVHAVLSPDEFALFDRHASRRVFGNGEVIFERGSAGRTMYVIAVAWSNWILARKCCPNTWPAMNSLVNWAC
jgi:hypothetical protein